MMRRDGFVSMTLERGSAEGVLTTRPIRFSGRYLFVNADTKGGELRAEILDERGQVIDPYTRVACIPFRGDDTCHRITWTSREDFGALAGQPVRFRFSLTRGHLFAFWVSPTRTGASGGYVAAGGPGFTGINDTAGQRA
jgi:hypothetical protein